jgi:hypothetical protein
MQDSGQIRKLYRCLNSKDQERAKLLFNPMLADKINMNYIYINIQSVPRSKHSVIQTSQLMLYREIIAVCSQIHTKHIEYTVWAERRIAEC